MQFYFGRVAQRLRLLHGSRLLKNFDLQREVVDFPSNISDEMSENYFST